MANLFTSQTPTITDASDGTPGITTGTTMVFAVDGTVTGVRFYATSTVSGTYTAGLWTVDSSDAGTGTVLASKTMGGASTGGTWNTVTFDTPVSVTTGVAYRAGIFSGAGRYVATVAFASFAGGSGGLTNGDIFAPPNNDNPVGAIVIKQGAFLIDAAFGYPTSGSGGTCYFVDVDFTAAGSTVNGTATVTGSGSTSAAVRQQAGSAVTGAGSTSAVSAQRSGATIAGAGSVSALVRQGATATAVGAGQVSASSASQVVTGTATVLGAGFVTAVSGSRITPRPNSGTTARPDTGTTARP